MPVPFQPIGVREKESHKVIFIQSDYMRKSPLAVESIRGSTVRPGRGFYLGKRLSTLSIAQSTSFMSFFFFSYLVSVSSTTLLRKELRIYMQIYRFLLSDWFIRDFQSLSQMKESVFLESWRVFLRLLKRLLPNWLFLSSSSLTSARLREWLSFLCCSLCLSVSIFLIFLLVLILVQFSYLAMNLMRLWVKSGLVGTWGCCFLRKCQTLAMRSALTQCSCYLWDFLRQCLLAIFQERKWYFVVSLSNYRRRVTSSLSLWEMFLYFYTILSYFFICQSCWSFCQWWVLRFWIWSWQNYIWRWRSYLSMCCECTFSYIFFMFCSMEQYAIFCSISFCQLSFASFLSSAICDSRILDTSLALMRSDWSDSMCLSFLVMLARACASCCLALMTAWSWGLWAVEKAERLRHCDYVRMCLRRLCLRWEQASSQDSSE